jgi:hypothetical protein
MRRVSGRKEVKADVRSPGAAPQKLAGAVIRRRLGLLNANHVESRQRHDALLGTLFAYKRWRLGLASNSEPSQIWSRTEADLGRKKCRVLDHDRLR